MEKELIDMFFFGAFLGSMTGFGLGLLYMSWWTRIPLRSPRPEKK